MKKQHAFLAILFIVIAIAGLSGPKTASAIEVNSPRDVEVPNPGEVTIRSALASASDGETITFAPGLNGGTIELSIIGDAHTVLKGEVMGMRDTPSGIPISYLVGYFERDYGKSALYAQKNVVIDASSLPSGITLAWAGTDENPDARVLAVYGNLTMTNVTITGGKSVAEELPPPAPDDEYGQLSTRARGGGVAVWGVARLVKCTLYDNHCRRDSSVPARGRDAGVFGGGIYADIVDMEDCVVSGNSLWASGVSGGGVFSVGGADATEDVSIIVRSTITGNGIRGMLGYGGGVYSDGGGIGNAKLLELRNCTIARNLVDVTDALPFSFVYWRGGAVYMSNGYLYMQNCTVVENEVYGVPRTDALGKPNLAGGVVATIGNAHAVERMTIGHSIIASNTVHPLMPWSGIPIPGAAYEQDIFTGTLLHFNSLGYNRIGTIDFSQMLVPVGARGWSSLCRRHYPKQGDEDGVVLADVINLEGGITLSDTIFSAGVDAPNPAVLHYEPRGNALDQVPLVYSVNETFAEYSIAWGGTNNFLEIILGRIESLYGLSWSTEVPVPDDDPGFAAGFTADFETFLASVDLDEDTPGNQPYTDPDGNDILTLADTQWFGPARTWPKEVPNYPYIEFWHRLDAELRNRNIPGMGPELLGDAEWIALFSEGEAPLVENPDITMDVWTDDLAEDVVLEAVDQLGSSRPANVLGDIGAYEYFSPPCSGAAYIDNCGECVEGDTGKQPCTLDCNGDWGGTAYVDNCAVCVSGNTGEEACIQDCNREWGGEADLDDCGRCAGGSTGILPCVPGTIIIEKQTDPDGETQSFEFTTDYGSNFFLADDETNDSGPLLSGTYSVSEINIPAGWDLTSAACDDGSDPSAIGLDPGETVICTFTNTKLSGWYTLALGAVKNGTITLDPPGGKYFEGTVVQVTATPDEGYEFDRWGGDLSGSTNPDTITMDSDKTVTATFHEGTVLVSGNSQEGSVVQYEWAYYQITSAASDTELRVELTNLSNDVDLYVRAGSKPTTSVYDCRPYDGGTTEETCTFPNPGATTWYIGVHGYSSGSFTIRATLTETECTLDSRFEKITLTQGGYYYTDRTYTLTSVPSQYTGLETVISPNDDRNRIDATGYMTFEMPYDGTVFVAFDSRATSRPDWLNGFTYTGNNIYTSLSTQPHLEVYSKSFSEGDCINFGANKAPGFSGGTVSNYLVFVDAAAAPVITVDVADVTVAEGQNATFSITATGFEPLHYLWTINGSRVGGDSPSCTISNAQLGDDGAYVVCVVSNALEQDTWSRVATLTVTPPSPCAPLDSRFEKITLTQGGYYYTDRTYTLTSVPSQYTGLETVISPNDDRNRIDATGYMTFEMPYDGTVFVAFDSRATSRPDWLNGFTYTGNNIYTSLSTQPHLEVYSKSFSEGDCINFGANKAPGFSGNVVSNYVIFYGTPGECSLDSRFDLTTLTQNMAYYTDRNYTLTSVPAQYLGMKMVKTPNDERNRTDAADYLTYEMTQNGVVYVGFDSRATSRPDWLNGFTYTGNNIYTSLSTQPHLEVYSKSYSEGDCMNFGANKAPGFSGGTVSNYMVFW